jgi:RnfABCDGE-type electron transport complex C subunit
LVALSKNEIITRIRKAGVVGAGGGGFPTHVKYGAQAEVVIANGAECEPLARVDQLQMSTRPKEIIRGLELAMNATGAKRGIIGLKAKYKDAIAALQAELDKQKKIELHLLDNFYPAGDEFVLVREVLGKVIPEFGLPLNVGVVVSNVSTLIDVARAVDDQAPLTHRYVSVVGLVKEPATFYVPLGTPVSSLLEAAGGALASDYRLVIGGPMMGSLAEDDRQPITKTTSLILVLEENHPVVQRRLRKLDKQIQMTRAACLKCMMCSEVCPRNSLGHRLYPDRLMRNIAVGIAEDLEAFRGAYLCSECGLCAVYGCVMNLDPAVLNRELKRQLSAAGMERPKAGSQVERTFGPMRRVPTYRLMARLDLLKYDCPTPEKPFEQKLRQLTIPLRQHAGAPAKSLVRVGQAVQAKEQIAQVEDKELGANLHSPFVGSIEAIDSDSITIKVG